MNLLLLFIITIWSGLSWAKDHVLKCDNKGGLLQVSTQATVASDVICPVYSVGGFADCLDTQKNSKDQRYISLGSPIKSFHGIRKRSDNYLRAPIEEIILMSLERGIDPYAVLAITILENPPRPGYQSYSYDRGNPAIDVLTLRNMWQCSYSKRQSKRPKIFLSPAAGSRAIKSRRSVVCEASPPSTDKWESPSLKFWEDGDDCCVVVNHFEKDEYELMKKVMGHTSLSYIKKYFSIVMNSSAYKKASSDYDRIATLLQAYNGFGKLGGEEKLPNSCLSGLRMSETPVYGAGAADIMLNFLMGNSEIRDIVDNSAALLGLDRVPSYSCQILGEGRHQIDPLVFSKLQFQYLKGRKQCGPLGYDFIGIKRNN